MADLIDRQVAIDAIKEIRSCIWEVDIPSPTVPEYIEHHKQMKKLMDRCDKLMINLVNSPIAQPEDWIERNKERILQAGMKGQEVEFRIGGRLFAIREKAQ